MTQLMTPTARILLGLAVADALGAATEFKSADSAAQHPDLSAGYQPGSPFGFAPGEATDDTQMTIAGLRATQAHTPGVSEALRRPANYATRVHGVFAGWAASCPPDIGGQTSRACRGLYSTALTATLGDLSRGADPAAGNGGLMRAAAPYLAGLRGPALLTATVIHTAVTHADPRCLTDAVAFALLLEKAEQTHDPHRAVHQVQLRLKEGIDLAPMMDALISAFPLTFSEREGMTKVLCEAMEYTRSALMHGYGGYTAAPSGFTTDTLRNAVAHLCAAWEAPSHTDTPDRYGDAVLRAVRGGGDADTIACVTGALAAAFDPYALSRPEHAHLLTGLRVGHAWAAWPDRAAPAAPLLVALADQRAQVWG